jgi:hypothetical protein
LNLDLLGAGEPLQLAPRLGDLCIDVELAQSADNDVAV